LTRLVKPERSDPFFIRVVIRLIRGPCFILRWIVDEIRSRA